MKINFQRLCRFLIPFALAICVVVSLSVPSFAAETYDYVDYISRIVEDPSVPGNVLVYVDLPVSGAWMVTDDTNNAIVANAWGQNSITVNIQGGHGYEYWVSPFGDIKRYSYTELYSWGGHSLDISSLPANTVIQQLIYFDFDGHASWSGMSGRIYCGHSPTRYEWSTYAYSSVGDGFLFEYTIPQGYEYAVTQQYFTMTSGYDGPLTATLYSNTLIISLNELYLQFQQTGANKDLINAISNKLEQQGQTIEEVLQAQQSTNDKLDDIMNNTPVPNRPNGTDRFQDLEEIEGTLRENAFNALDAFLEMSNSTSEGLLPYFTSMLAVTALIEMFADLPFFQVLLGVSFCLGLTGTILGIYNGVHSRSDNGPSSEQLKEARKSILENHHKGDN